MWKNSKIRIYSLILIFLFANNLLADEIKDPQSIGELKTYYDLKIPEKFELEIIGKEYIDYLEQIKDVGERINLNSSKINSQKKRWIKASLKSDKHKKKFKVNIILHGDFNDHISLPYSSLRIKSKKNFFYQLKDFILFKPKTRRYEGEVFGSIFMREIGLISPFTRYVKLKINNNSYEDYIFQEKIGKYLIERHGFRNEPIFEYDEKNLWNRYTLGLPSKKLSSFYKLDNSTYANDHNNIEKIFRAVTLKKVNNLNLYHEKNDLFELALILLGGCHGLHDHNRKYIFDSLKEKFLPIYYDGMLFYDKSNNLCEQHRSQNKIDISETTYNKFNEILTNEKLKLNIKKKYQSLVFSNEEKFEYFWNYLIDNLNKYKILVVGKNNSKLVKKENKKENNDFFEDLKRLHLPYPTIYYLKDLEKNKFFLCYEWFSLNEKIKIETTGGAKITKNDQGCRMVNSDTVVSLLKNKISYKTSVDKRLNIYPILVGNVKQNSYYDEYQTLRVEKKILDYNKINETINLPSSTISILSLDQNHKIENLTINSSKTNDSALIIKLNKNNLKRIEFNEINLQNQVLNKKIQNRNITGCINIVDSDFKIENIIINGSNCEDGLNIIKSTGQIENIKIKDAISDGVDFDYSNLKLDFVDVDNAKGDCLDFSFGKYEIEDGNLNNCADKAVSVGETSNLKVNKLNILNSNIGIASKDNSKVEIDNIKLKNLEYCLSVYNKKKEFGGGIINYLNMECDNFIEKYNIGKKSKIFENGKSVQ